MIDISVIVPIFNVEKYLAECLESILSIDSLVLQVICIDDCSTDKSYNILNFYANDRRIEIHRNLINKGVAYSRNIGLDYAKGNYILFVDPDDYVDAQGILKIYKKIKKNKLDVIYFDVEEFTYEDSEIKINGKRKRKTNYKIQSGMQLFNSMQDNNEYFGCVWNGLYSKDFINNNSFRFIDGILHEDIAFAFETIMNAERAMSVVINGYFYRQRKESIMHQDNYMERAYGLLITCNKLFIIWHELKIDKDISPYENSIKKYINSIVDMLIHNLNKVKKSEKQNNILYSFMENFIINIYRDFNKIFDESVIKKLRSCNRIAIYGAGEFAQNLIHFLNIKDVIINAIFVSSLDKNVKDIDGITIQQYTEEKGYNIDLIIIAVKERKNKTQIKNRLVELKFQGDIFEI